MTEQPTEQPADGSVIEPSLQLSRFTCPSCGEVHDMVWLNLSAERVNNPMGVPLRIAGADLERLANNPQFPPEVRDQKVDYWNKVNSGYVFLDRWAPVQTDLFMAGLEVSVCSGCMATGVWLGGKLVYPVAAA